MIKERYRNKGKYKQYDEKHNTGHKRRRGRVIRIEREGEGDDDDERGM